MGKPCKNDRLLRDSNIGTSGRLMEGCVLPVCPHSAGQQSRALWRGRNPSPLLRALSLSNGQVCAPTGGTRQSQPGLNPPRQTPGICRFALSIRTGIPFNESLKLRKGLIHAGYGQPAQSINLLSCSLYNRCCRFLPWMEFWAAVAGHGCGCLPCSPDVREVSRWPCLPLPPGYANRARPALLCLGRRGWA